MEVSLSGKLSSLSLISQKKLLHVLLNCGNEKDLIIESSLIEQLERVCAASWLRQHGVRKIFKLEAKVNPAVNDSRVYMIPSCLIKLKTILDQINETISQRNSTENRNVSIIIIPRVLSTHESLLEEEGLAGLVNLYSYQWEMILIDQSVLSLEFPSIFKSTFVYSDSSLLSCISNSLWTLFQVLGKPDLFVSIGKQSHSVLEMYDIYSETFDKSDTIKADKDIGALIIMDRDQDYAASLLTPATYTGLLYELFNIKCGKLDLNVDNTKYKQSQLNYNIPEEKTEKMLKTQTNMLLDCDSDAIYSEIKHRHFSTVFSILNSKVKTFSSNSENINKLELHQMKNYVSNQLQQLLNSKRALANHIFACETVVDLLGDTFEELQATERSILNNRQKKSNLSFIETSLCTNSNMYTSLRHFCLISLLQGLSYEEYSSFVTKYLHAFGYKFSYIFQNLCSAGLLVVPAETKLQLGIPNLSTISDRLPLFQNNSFQTTAVKLKQLQSESDDVKNPTCPSYVFSGSYVPLVAVLAKMLLSSENVNDLLAKLQLINEIKLGGQIFDNFKQSIDDLGEKISQLSVDGGSSACDIDVACRDIKTASNYLKSDKVKFSVMPLRPKSLLIFIVGGMTQAEIAASNLLEKLLGSRIIIASDSIISGDNLIKAAM